MNSSQTIQCLFRILTYKKNMEKYLERVLKPRNLRIFTNIKRLVLWAHGILSFFLPMHATCTSNRKHVVLRRKHEMNFPSLRFFLCFACCSGHWFSPVRRTGDVDGVSTCLFLLLGFVLRLLENKIKGNVWEISS